jgi:FlaG/FlaF family flagellin (archaellin)
MVAITVILAAVIGTFVLGLGGSVQQNAPQASFTFDYKDPSSGVDYLNVTHDGGDAVAASQINITASGPFGISAAPDASGSGIGGNYVGTAGYPGSVSPAQSDYALDDVSAASNGGSFPSDVGAGATIYLKGAESSLTNSNPDLSDDTFRVIWSSQNGDNTATLAKFSGPNA